MANSRKIAKNEFNIKQIIRELEVMNRSISSLNIWYEDIEERLRKLEEEKDGTI